MATTTATPVQEPKKVTTNKVFDPTNDDVRAAPRVEIRLSPTTDRNAEKVVFIQVNNASWRITRGHWVSVPYPIALALRDAVEKKRIDEIDPVTGKVNNIWEEGLSYEFQIRGEDEIVEDPTWRQRQEEVAAKRLERRIALIEEQRARL